MVTPVLHVLPLTIRSPDLPNCSSAVCIQELFLSAKAATMPVVDELFLQSTVANFFFACGALNGFHHLRLRRA